MDLKPLTLLLLCLSSALAASLVSSREEIPQETPVLDNQDGDSPGIVIPVAEEPPVVGLAAENDPAEDVNVVADAVSDVPAAVEEVMAADAPAAEPQNSSSSQDSGSGWSLDSIRDGFQTVNGYFDSVVEMMGGYNGVCQYRCQYDKTPLPRGDYKVPEPSGCSSFLLGLQLDMGVPAMTKCCSQLEVCYNTCGSNKYRCDSKFRLCLHGICSDLRRSLGFVSKVEACESMADGLFNTVWTLGCRPYMNSQRAACFCEGEEKDEL